jgi:hypothetical protein
MASALMALAIGFSLSIARQPSRMTKVEIQIAQALA